MYFAVANCGSRTNLHFCFLDLVMQRARGGRLQRQARAARQQQAQHSSELAHFLVLQCLWGFCSIPYANKIARLAKLDIDTAVSAGGDFSFHDLNELASIGTEGRHAKNMFVDLSAKLSPSHFPEYTAPLPLKIFERPVKPILQSFLLPHETFSALYHCYPEAWKERILPHQGALDKFWSEMVDHPLMIGHPVHRRANWKKLCIPISMHGDGVPCTGVGKSWVKSMELLSWTSCLAAGATMKTFFFIHGIFQKCISTEFNQNTMSKLWQLLSWSLTALWMGEWPRHNM